MCCDAAAAPAAAQCQPGFGCLVCISWLAVRLLVLVLRWLMLCGACVLCGARLHVLSQRHVCGCWMALVSVLSCCSYLVQQAVSAHGCAVVWASCIELCMVGVRRVDDLL